MGKNINKMKYRKGEIITRVYNHQVIFNGEYIETQMKSRGGEWRFVDCVYDCIHCGICLGCNIKGSWSEDEYGNISFNMYSLECDKSPNGLHEFDI